MTLRTHDNKISGQACVELAMILPVLVALTLGLFDFACALRANNTISNMSREGANLASRSAIGAQDIMNALADTAQPLDMRKNGMIYITVVEGTNRQPRIVSQTAWENGGIAPGSDIGTPSNPNVPARNLDGLNLPRGKTANVVEVFYHYQSIFSNSVFAPAGNFYSRTIF